ncbi:MAG: aminopeptidase [Clostridiales bacterium]|nr:aminopeptidase [Clostridiales bacterium]
MEEKKEETLLQQRKKALCFAPQNGYDRLEEGETAKISAYCDGYKTFLDEGKTERECVDYAIALARAAGFRPLVRGEKLQPGDKVYRNNRGKSLLLAVIGQESLDKGAVIGAAHIDSPRLDLKQNPLYEEKELAYCKTHYYGGIKKYQWTTIPLALHGLVVRRDGTQVTVRIGEDPGDPQFTVGDLLPHLAGDQAKKTMGAIVSAEQLNLFVGSRPFGSEEGGDRVKVAILDLLHEKYGMVEEDFLSAELMAVPAAKAVDIGLDRSVIGAYGQDDRVCAYACLKALLDLKQTPRRTAVCVLADKEEVGSLGVTGMQSAAFDIFMSDLCQGQGVALKACYETSFCLSADVTAAYDPNFAEAYEVRNSAFFNYGVCVSKYTGARGKSGASDASAEVVGLVRRVFGDNGVVWQLAELGKTDQGGGGTVACYMANRNIDTIDAGVPVLSMHAPFETTAKLDCYMAYKGMLALYHH